MHFCGCSNVGHAGVSLLALLRVGDADCGHMIADCGTESPMKLKHKTQLEESPRCCMDHARCCVPEGGSSIAEHDIAWCFGAAACG